MGPSTRSSARRTALLTALTALLLPTSSLSAEGRVLVAARVIEIEAPRLAAIAARQWAGEPSSSNLTSLWARWIHPVELGSAMPARPGESPSTPAHSPAGDLPSADRWLQLEVDRLGAAPWPPGHEMVLGHSLAWMQWVTPRAEGPAVVQIEWIGN